jgi:uncharacterized RDD family membrane protein YckC
MTDQGATGISFYPVVWLYNALTESSAISATPGKMIFRIAVLDLKGQKISFGKATLRIFLKLITGLESLAFSTQLTMERGKHSMIVGRVL